LKGSSSTIREPTRPFTRSTLWILLEEGCDAFIEEELFHHKRMNLTVSERHPLDFNDRESCWFLLKGYLPR
jgi:hypothetical protein